MTTQQLKEGDFYRTSDLALAGVISMHLPVEAIDRVMDSRKAYWLFQRSYELDELVRQYYRKELSVEPSAYFERISFLKTMLYSNN